jgi:ABC-2 type transport system ATP-binding protein
MEVLAVDNITVDYGGGKGVFDLSFSVGEGEVLGFLGPNGAGKTTTIRQLMGFAHPDKGGCKILGLDCKTKSAEIQNSVGYLPGEIAFMDDMTGMQFIKFIAEMKGIKDLSRADELISYFELNTSGKIKKMSKGMKQKIGIVCAFMQNPKILILDEPTSGLDPLMQNKFVELIRTEKERGATILMSSHMFEEIERTCDKAVIIKSGRLVANEDMNTLKETKRKGFVVTIDTDDMAEKFANEVTGVESIKDNKVTVGIQGDIMPFIKILAKYQVTNLEPVTQNLENLFMHYYGGGYND